jgi:hypothetical protein
MKHRDYLFMTVLLLILTFSLSEAAIMGPSAAPFDPLLGSVTLPAKNDPGIGQPIILAELKESNSALSGVSTTRKRISKPQSSLPQARSKFPKNDSNQRNPGTPQPGGQGLIYDRWGK